MRNNTEALSWLSSEKEAGIILKKKKIYHTLLQRLRDHCGWDRIKYVKARGCERLQGNISSAHRGHTAHDTVAVVTGSVQVQVRSRNRMQEEVLREVPPINEEPLAIDSDWEKKIFSKNIAPGMLTPPVEDDCTSKTISAAQIGLKRLKKQNTQVW